ncbi:MAG: antibiotic biosynthesis monooxygenase [Burkholderiales bacterium]|nr:antibiotic biosynthesis monooxygenase [Burkholderiales bacterium]
MILESASQQVRPGQSAAFEAAFAAAQRIISSMPGYRSHELQRCLEREGHYLLLVRLGSSWPRCSRPSRRASGSRSCGTRTTPIASCSTSGGPTGRPTRGPT